VCRGVGGVHAVRFRRSGPVIFGEMHIELQEDLPLDKAHAISEEVEERIKKQFKGVESITIHAGRRARYKEKTKVGIPILEDKGLESVASLHFGNAPLFALVEIENGQITNVYSKVNAAAKLLRKKGITTAQFLVDAKADAVIVGGLGEGPFHLLRDKLVQIYSLPEPVKVEEAIHLLIQNKLEKMTSPIDTHKAEGNDE
jgi:predicted Fe-Mo cluster-binding NifX family protein